MATKKKGHEKTRGDFVAISLRAPALLHDADHIQRFYRPHRPDFRPRLAFVRTPDYCHVHLIFWIVKTGTVTQRVSDADAISDKNNPDRESRSRKGMKSI